MIKKDKPFLQVQSIENGYLVTEIKSKSWAQITGEQGMFHYYCKTRYEVASIISDRLGVIEREEGKEAADANTDD